MHQPNTNLKLMGVDVAINSRRGFRDVEHPQQKAPGTTRIALLGDSGTFGWGVPYGQRYSEIIAQRWNEASKGKFELICTGHGNYNSRQEYSILSDHLAHDNLDGVIQFWYINDAEPLPQHRDAPWYSHLYTAIFLWSKTDLLQRRLGGRQNYVDYYRGLYQDGAPGLADFKLALSQTGAWTRERKIRGCSSSCRSFTISATAGRLRVCTSTRRRQRQTPARWWSTLQRTSKARIREPSG